MCIHIEYRYKRTGNYPGNVVGAWYDGLARHHILSFPFMLSFAVVTFWYIATHRDDAASYAEAKLDAFFKARGENGWSTLCAPFKNKRYLEKEVGDANGILNWICWAESNLFIGPAAIHRIDDPSQKMDHIPLSMGETEKGKKVMDKAAEVKSVWATTVCHSGNSGKDGQSIPLSIKDGELPNFVKVFVDYICLSQPDVIYRSKYKDWAAYLDTDTSGKTPHQFWINTKRTGVINDERYQFAIRNQKAGANEPWVCITTFNDKDVLGVKAGNPGSNCGDNPF